MIKIDKKLLQSKLKATTNPFHTLVRSIIFQQISTKAGYSIHRRFLLLFKGKRLTPDLFFSLPQKRFLKAGLSGRKVMYIHDLANKFKNKTLNHENFAEMSDEEIRDNLVQVKGIGPWTVDMFLIFGLARMNVLPLGDLAIRRGFTKAFKLRKTPSEKQMRKLAEPYRGMYTCLSLYLWGLVDEENNKQSW